jgi:hypothetical protein
MVRVRPTPGGSARLDGGARTRQSLLTSVSLMTLGLAAVIAAITPSPASAQITISMPEAGRTWGGGDLTITSDGMVSEPGGVGFNILSDAGTLTNSGTITANTAISVDGGVTVSSIANTGSSARIAGSSSVAISNSGSVGAISNEGTITGYTAIKNTGGVIETITNIGVISGFSALGIYNDNSISSIINSGVLSTIIGAATAIKNDTGGSIGTITNEGKISGGAETVFLTPARSPPLPTRTRNRRLMVAPSPFTTLRPARSARSPTRERSPVVGRS